MIDSYEQRKVRQKQIIENVRNNNLKELDSLLKKPGVRAALSYDASEVVVEACRAGNTQMLDYLLNCPHFESTEQFSFRLVPAALNVACQKGHLGLVQYLLEEAPSEQRLSFDTCLKAAIAEALPHNKVEVAVYLLSKPEIAPFVDLSYNKNQALIRCLQNQAFDSVRFLLEPHNYLEKTVLDSIMPLNMADNQAQSILFIGACRAADKDFAIEVLNKGYVKNHVSELILLAADKGNASVVEYLITNSPYAQQLTPGDAEKAFVIACETQHMALAKMLLTHSKFKLTEHPALNLYIEKKQSPSSADIKIIFEQAKLKDSLSISTAEIAKPQFKI